MRSPGRFLQPIGEQEGHHQRERTPDGLNPLRLAGGDFGAFYPELAVGRLRGAAPFRTSPVRGIPEELPWLSIELTKEQSRALDELAGLPQVPKEVLVSAAVRDS